MKKNKSKKKMKTDEWNEIIINREENETKEDDADWEKKDKEDNEKGQCEREFHEEVYDT